MKQILALFFVTGLITLHSGCKKEINEATHSIPALPDSVASKIGRVILPDGYHYSLNGSSVQMLGYSAPVSDDGKTELVDAKEEALIAWLFDKDNNPVMAGFITDSTHIISTATTAKVLLYYASGLIFSSDTLRPAFINATNNNSYVNEWVATFTESWKTDPLIIEKGGFTSALEKTIKAIIASQDSPDPGTPGSGKNAAYSKKVNTKIPGLFIQETDFRSGIQFFEADLGRLSASNRYRRRTHAFLYKESYKDNNNVSHNILSSIESSTKADMDFAISAASANTSITGELGAMIEGKLDEIAQSKLDPIALTLSDNESEVTYKIHVVGPGIQSKIPVTTDEIAKQTRLEVETFAIDFMFPLIMEIFGWSEQINKSGLNIGSGKTEAFIDQVEIFLKASPDVYENIKDGDYMAAAKKAAELLIIGTADKYLQQIAYAAVAIVHDAGYKSLGKKIPMEELLKTTDRAESMLKKVALILKVVNAAMLAHDLSRITQAFLSSNQMEEWTIVAREAKVTLLPDSSNISAGQELELTAEIKNMQETGGDTHPFFEWSTTGKYGKLKDSKGHTGSSFATADNKVVFESDALAELKNGDNIDYIYVKASFNNVLIGMDTVMVNVKKTNYEMRPANAVVTGKKYSKAANDINLYLYNINTSVRDIPNHESLDFKIEWSTPGIYGNLTGATTTYNDDDIVYKATSEQTGVFTENITARIYTKNKSETDYSFYSSITGKVKIDNEEKKKIIFVSAALFHGDSTHPYYYNGAGWGTLGQCYKADGVVVDKDPDAERYELTFDITKNIIGAPKAHSWKADAASPYPPPTFVPGYSTKTYRVVYSWGALNYNPAQGEKHVNDSGTNIAGAWITIYLK